MENPISWAVLVILVIVLMIWFAGKCEDELEKNRRENEIFFENWENERKGK